VRLIDRVLSRDAGYNEGLYSGAYVVTAADPSGRDREGPAPVIRHAREAYASNGIVFACIAARMALFAEAEFTFRSQIDKHLFGTADLELLEQPWPNATAGELLARMEADVSWAGNSYIRRAQAADDAGPQLVQMRPDCTIIVTEEARDELGRTFRRPIGYSEDLKPLGIDREPQFFTVDEVAHYSPVPDPSASFRGMSWLTPVMREIGADQALTQYKTSHVSRGAMPGMVLKYSQKLSEPTVEKLKKRFAALFAGPENAGKTLVLDEGADVTVAGSTLEQLQFTAVQAAGETRIAAASGVPVEIVGIEGPRSASGNYELAIRRFADLWARPHWRMACACLQHLLPSVPPASRLWYDVSGIAALREGELARGQALLVRTQAIAALVTAGYSRDTAIAAVESGDLSQLQADPGAAPPGAPTGARPPQAGVPQDLPGAVAPNKPNAKPAVFTPMPGMPNGARG
jgi:phage portal protein BeeE